MGFPEYERFDAVGLAALVRDGQVTPAELLDAAIERVESRNPAINAVVNKLYDEGRRAVSAGLPEGPLRGVPFLLKDIGALMTGAVTTFGSRLFADFRADHDSEMVARYRKSGLVIFGYTNTPELGLTATTEPRLFGATRNPWNLGYSPGGSSGGAAAAVAAGMVPAAHGSDGGGSIRVPASACGLVGLKPTRARNPSGPDVGEGWGGLAVSHALARTVRDSAASLDATAGPDVGDPYWAPPPPRSFQEEVGADPGRLRIAVCNDRVARRGARPRSARGRRRDTHLAHDVGSARPERGGLRPRDRKPPPGRPRRGALPHDLGPLADADHVSPAAPPRRTRHMSDDADGYVRMLMGAIGFTSLFNAAGTPAISLPLASVGS